VAQRLHADHALIVAQERLAGELRLAVDHHPAAAAHRHVAGPAIRERRVEVLLDVVQRVEHHPIVPEGHLVALKARLLVRLGVVPEYFKLNHACAPE
jgi:hypothetical protein